VRLRSNSVIWQWDCNPRSYEYFQP
jgi:hypothetical protein